MRTGHDPTQNLPVALRTEPQFRIWDPKPFVAPPHLQLHSHLPHPPKPMELSDMDLSDLRRPCIHSCLGDFHMPFPRPGALLEFLVWPALTSSRPLSCHLSPLPQDIKKLDHPLLSWHSHSSSHCLSFSAIVSQTLLDIYPFASLLSICPSECEFYEGRGLSHLFIAKHSA